MKNLIKFEEAGILALSSFLLYRMDMGISWWLFIILFLSPDIGMIGYLINTKIGAYTYNLTHHRAVACAVVIIGVTQSSDYVLFAGLLLLAHGSFDRMLGYGLKFEDSFKHTSIGNL